jgi:hypothetical protein
MAPNVAHFLSVKQNIREKRHDKRQLTETKKNRVKRKMEILKEDEAIAKRERSKRDGTYKKGQNMDDGGADGYTAAELLAAAATPPAKRSKKSTTKSSKDVKCKHCFLLGHSRRTSSKCLMNKDRKLSKPVLPPESQAPMTLEEADRLACEDMNEMDQMDLANDDVSVDASLAMYEDAATWSDDEDDEDDETPLIAGQV